MKILHILLAACVCLASCVAHDEQMVAANGNTYRYRGVYVGGEHDVTTSNGSRYTHSLSASFKDFLQAVGVSISTWSLLGQQKAMYTFKKYEAGQITQQQANAQMAAIQQAEIAAQGQATSEAIGAGAEIAPLVITPP